MPECLECEVLQKECCINACCYSILYQMNETILAKFCEHQQEVYIFTKRQLESDRDNLCMPVWPAWWMNKN